MLTSVPTADPLVREAFIVGAAIGTGFGYWLGGHMWWLIMRPRRTRGRRNWRGVWR